jgi:hypothetical protein
MGTLHFGHLSDGIGVLSDRTLPHCGQTCLTGIAQSPYGIGFNVSCLGAIQELSLQFRFILAAFPLSCQSRMYA